MKKFLIVSAIVLLAGIATSNAQDYTFSSDLQLGSSGPDVSALQSWLIGQGYSIPSISSGAVAKGYFGGQTQSALISYQRSIGLPAYGFFGPMTRGWIRDHGNGQRGDSLRVTSPNGGETWVKGTTQTITWTGSQGMLNQTGDIKLEYPTPACAQPGQIIRCMIMVRAPQIIAQGVNLNSGSYQWVVGNVAPYFTCANGAGNCGGATIADAGQYKIQICPTNGSACDDSDNNFTIASNSSTGNQPIISGVDAPTTLTAGQTGTWTVHATDPLNGTLSYSILWGDEPGYVATGGTSVVPAVVQTSTFTHSYANAGNYMVTITVRNSAGQQVQTSSSVNVTGNPSAGPLKITSPNGGEVWQLGTTHTITWTSPYYFAATTADIKITQQVVCNAGYACPAIAYAPYVIATNIPINQNSFTWNVGSVRWDNPILSSVPTMAAGQYTIQICQSGTNVCDSSDSSFTVTSASNANQTVTVTSPNGGEVWQANSNRQISWNFLNADANSKVDIYLGQLLYVPCAMIPGGYGQCSPQFQQSYVLDKNIAANSTYNWIVGTDIFNNPIPAGYYGIRICVAGTTNCDTSDGSFSIVGQAVPYVQPYTCPAGYVCTPATH